MKAYQKNIDEILTELDTGREGLSEAESARRREKYGPNKLDEGKSDGLIKRFLKQLAEPMTLVLLAAALVSAALTVYNNVHTGAGEFPTDVIIILAVVLINAILGVVQESKAEDAIKALQEMSSATSKVMREGRQVTVDSRQLVPGDVIVLEAGDSVPADCRVIESASLKTEEAALTGESLPVEKMTDALNAESVPLGDRKNMVYMGSTAVYGRAVAVVTATGMETEMGHIAGALTRAQENKTPLQHKLGQLSRILTWLVLGICVFIFVLSLLETGSFTVESVLNTFMVAVSLAVAAIPEGLSTVVTIVLSIGVTNMSKRSAIIRKMTAVETLGCTQIICSDKTGTLTMNRMTVTQHYAADEETLARAMSLCSDAQWDNAEKQAVGEPTECALVAYAHELGQDKNAEKLRLPRIGEVPFDSLRKMMTTVHKDGSGEIIQYTKGAPDIVLAACDRFLSEGGEILPMTEEKRREILSVNTAYANQALRVLAAAVKPLDREPEAYTAEALENGLVFAGLVGMIDPVRPEVCAAMEECRSAGIRPVMITGDHKDTAVAIAMSLGMISSAQEALTGAELDKLDDETFDRDVDKYSVYARVQPEHKTRIVNAWQKKGCVTAMTGDGVNDAPSIKNADIGVGMGITGTDVTKNVADMILADDNFATIVSAVGEGRRIYDNIRKAIQFLLTSNLSEVLTIFVATLLNFTIFKAPHLLWINLITDCFPALALGVEKPEKGIMERKPRPSREGIFAGGMGIAIALQGALITALTLISYFIGKKTGTPELGTTMAFVTLSISEVLHSINMRSLKGSLLSVKTRNPLLYLAAAVSAAATVAVVRVPFLVDAFDFAALSGGKLLIAAAIAVAVIPAVEGYKAVMRALKK